MKTVEELISSMREHRQHFLDVLFWMERTERFREKDLKVCNELLAVLEGELRAIRRTARECRVSPEIERGGVLRVVRG